MEYTADSVLLLTSFLILYYEYLFILTVYIICTFFYVGNVSAEFMRTPSASAREERFNLLYHSVCMYSACMYSVCMYVCM